LFNSLSILGNLCSSPGKDEASTMPRFEIFKVDVFEMSSELIRNVFALYEQYQDCGLKIDLELIDAISFFLRNVLNHLYINPQKIDGLTNTSSGQDFISQIANNLLTIENKLRDKTGWV
jgi:hypothetical protein